MYDTSTNYPVGSTEYIQAATKHFSDDGVLLHWAVTIKYILIELLNEQIWKSKMLNELLKIDNIVRV